MTQDHAQTLTFTTTCNGTSTADYYFTMLDIESMRWNISEGRDKNMRRLYRITVVDPKTEGFFSPQLVIAKDEAQAFLRVRLEPEVHANPDLYDICVEIVGDVRAKKETQKVKVVEGDEE